MSFCQQNTPLAVYLHVYRQHQHNLWGNVCCSYSWNETSIKEEWQEEISFNNLLVWSTLLLNDLLLLLYRISATNYYFQCQEKLNQYPDLYVVIKCISCHRDFRWLWFITTPPLIPCQNILDLLESRFMLERLFSTHLSYI